MNSQRFVLSSSDLWRGWFSPTMERIWDRARRFLVRVSQFDLPSRPSVVEHFDEINGGN